MEPLVSIVAIALAPILGAYYYRHGRLVRLAGRRVLQQWSVLLGSIVESLQGMRVIKVHHAERFEVKRFRGVNRHYVRAEYPLAVANLTTAIQQSRDLRSEEHTSELQSH